MTAMPEQPNFTRNRYAIVRGLVSTDICQYFRDYAALRIRTGQWRDPAGKISREQYGDPFAETLLETLRPAIEEHTGKRLLPTYSFARWYQKGGDLKAHYDREACEYSVSIGIAWNYSNLSEDYEWPLFADGIPFVADPGDALLYKGCEVKHWREPLAGNDHLQLFLHYVDADGPYAAEKFDRRLALGLREVPRVRD